ncbi:MAG: GyrI-like domain-containing protein [Spirochaetaceae bacterium]|nr:MAG: GyrI-like domain-containing protein [Spirochaetaceae bacterium]
MQKIDYKKRLKQLYSAPAKAPVIVEVPLLNFIMVDGAGDPNTSEQFQQAVEALFSASYTLKFMIKKGPLAVDYGVLPLEGVWWAEDMTAFATADKASWKWTLMIMQPEYVTPELVRQALEQTAKKKDLPALAHLRFETFHEGLSAQVLHIGPFSAEGPTIERLHRFIRDNGYRRRGKHREIYLSDLRRAEPEKLKTIIRQPVESI